MLRTFFVGICLLGALGGASLIGAPHPSRPATKPVAPTQAAVAARNPRQQALPVQGQSGPGVQTATSSRPAGKPTPVGRLPVPIDQLKLKSVNTVNGKAGNGADTLNPMGDPKVDDPKATPISTNPPTCSTSDPTKLNLSSKQLNRFRGTPVSSAANAPALRNPAAVPNP